MRKIDSIALTIMAVIILCSVIIGILALIHTESASDDTAATIKPEVPESIQTADESSLRDGADNDAQETSDGLEPVPADSESPEEDEPMPSQEPTAQDLEPDTVEDYKLSADSYTQVFFKSPYEDWFWIGDSRTEGMSYAVDIDYLAEVGCGLKFFNEHYDEIVSMTGKNIVFNLGVNDLYRIDAYIETLNNLPESFYAHNLLIVMSVNPCKENYAYLNPDIENFNYRMQTELRGEIVYVDTYNYLLSGGFDAPGGLHYTKATYLKLYDFVTSSVSP